MTKRHIAAADLTPHVADDEIVAVTALIRAKILPMTRLAAVIEQVGSAVKLVQLSEADRLFAPADASHDLVGAVTPADLTKAVRDLSEWRSEPYAISTVLDAGYPEALLAIFNRPPLLFIQGSWMAPIAERAVAVVGTRRATPEGIRRAERLASELVAARFTILSGLAAGIDSAAHRTALRTGGRTSAVMGTGLRRRFPAENVQLADDILASGGALISQFFPNQPPATWTFPMRNVVMSGLSLATVVVEAGATSGARLQARVALQHGRTVFLLGSLVKEHEWARRYVTEGAYGTRAIEVHSPDDIISRLEGAVELDAILAG